MLECAAPDVPTTADNLAWRAAALLRRETGAASGVRIRVVKRIPVAAGLGGGSADAAAVLAGLQRLERRRLRPRQVTALAVALGMDVPFFLGRSPALARGRGEELRPVRSSADLSLVLANPGFPLATRDVYARIESADYSDGRQVDALVTALRRGARAVAAAVTNGLERAAARLWPGLAEVKAALLEAGCVAALMSGSGPTVFGIAPSLPRGAPDPGRAGDAAVAPLGGAHGDRSGADDPGRGTGRVAGGPGAQGPNDLGRGQAARRGTLDPVFGGSNPPAPTNPHPRKAAGITRRDLDDFHFGRGSPPMTA